MTAISLFSIGLGLYSVNADFFFGLGWFFLLSSTVSIFTDRLSGIKSRWLVYLFIVIVAAVWFVFNDVLFYLLSTRVQSNPYGEYFIDQFEFRLTLSIFAIKTILNLWLTDTRLLFAGALWMINMTVFPRLLKYIFSILPIRTFEFVVLTTSQIITELKRYAVTSVGRAVISGALWCLATFLLQFDNFIIMTLIMLLCAFIPYAGLFVAALLSLLFVESGLFLIQLGGMLIALASIWFVDHTLIREQKSTQNLLLVILMTILPILGYVIFVFPGFFFSAPFAYIAGLISFNIAKNWALIHKTSAPVPRNA